MIRTSCAARAGSVLAAAATVAALAVPSDARAVSPGPNGYLVYVHQVSISGHPYYHVFRMTSAGQHRTDLMAGQKISSGSPAASPNDKQIAYVRKSHVWVASISGTHVHELDRTLPSGVTEEADRPGRRAAPSWPSPGSTTSTRPSARTPACTSRATSS